MMVIYDRETRELVSYAGQVFDNGEWREARLEEIYPDTDRSKWDVVYVKEALKYAITSLDELQLKLDENGNPVGVERKSKLPQIHLTTGAVDADGDGVPELPADGQSKAMITIEVKNSRGERVEQDFALNLSTTGGALSARRVTAQNGQTTVELTSSLETVSVTITASAEGAESGSIALEFMPPNQ